MCPLCFLSAAADGIGGLSTEQTHLNVPVADPSAWATAMNNLGIMPMGLTGQQLVSGRAMHLSPLISYLDFYSTLCYSFFRLEQWLESKVNLSYSSQQAALAPTSQAKYVTFSSNARHWILC